MKTYIAKGSTAYWKAISALFLGSFVTFATLYCLQPLIPEFSREFQVSPAVASLSLSLATVSLAFAMLGVAWISNSLGRKQLMSAALFSSAVLAILVAFSPNFTLLLVIRVLQGAVLAGFPAIAMAYINEEFAPDCAGLAMGIYVSGTAIGGMLGRMLMGALTDLFSWHVALALVGVISLAISLWFWVSLPASRHFSPCSQSGRERLQALKRNMAQPALYSLYAVGFLLLGSFVALYNYIGYVLMAAPYYLSQTTVGFIFLVYIVGTFSSTLLGKMTDHIGNGKSLCVSVAVMLAGALISLEAPLVLKIAGIAIFTFGFFGGHTVASSWVGKLAGKEKSQASSLYLLFYYIGASVLGTLGGKFLEWYGWNGVVLLVSLSLTGALLIAVSLFYRTQQVCARA